MIHRIWKQANWAKRYRIQQYVWRSLPSKLHHISCSNHISYHILKCLFML